MGFKFVAHGNDSVFTTGMGAECDKSYVEGWCKCKERLASIQGGVAAVP